MELQTQISEANLKVNILENEKKQLELRVEDSKSQGDQTKAEQSGLVTELLQKNMQLEKIQLMKEFEEKEKQLKDELDRIKQVL